MPSSESPAKPVTVEEAHQAAARAAGELEAAFNASPSAALGVAWIDAVVRVRHIGIAAATILGNAILSNAVQAVREACPDDGLIQSALDGHGIVSTARAEAASKEEPDSAAPDDS